MKKLVFSVACALLLAGVASATSQITDKPYYEAGVLFANDSASNSSTSTSASYPIYAVSWTIPLNQKNQLSLGYTFYEFTNLGVTTRGNRVGITVRSEY